MGGWVEKQKRRAIRRALGGPIVGVIEEHGDAIHKLGSGVAMDIRTLRDEMLKRGEEQLLALARTDARLRVLEGLARLPWYWRWWWVLTGRGL